MADKKKSNRKPPLTENTTGVYRLPVTVKDAIEAEALTDGVTPAAIVRQSVARELKRRGYDLEENTRKACGV